MISLNLNAWRSWRGNNNKVSLVGWGNVAVSWDICTGIVMPWQFLCVVMRVIRAGLELMIRMVGGIDESMCTQGVGQSDVHRVEWSYT